MPLLLLPVKPRSTSRLLEMVSKILQTCPPFYLAKLNPSRKRRRTAQIPHQQTALSHLKTALKVETEPSLLKMEPKAEMDLILLKTVPKAATAPSLLKTELKVEMDLTLLKTALRVEMALDLLKTELKVVMALTLLATTLTALLVSDLATLPMTQTALILLLNNKPLLSSKLC